MSRKPTDTLEDAGENIQDAIDRGGEFAHNRISATLRIVANKWGKDAANLLVRQYKLKRRFKINEED